MKRILAATLAVSSLFACRPSQETSPTKSEMVVARFGDFSITAADLDTRILALPASERPKPGEDLDTWFREQLRQMAVEHRLRQEAEDSDLAESEEMQKARHEAKKDLTVQMCMAEVLPDVEPVSESEVRQAYEERKEALSVPERRSTFHIYMRRTEGRDTKAEITEIRNRVLQGESFQRLAAANSESESRHQNGALGWISSGQLPEGFEGVIFGLEEGIPSEPVETRDGFHLFYVDQINAARTMAFEEAAPTISSQLTALRRDEALAKIESTFSMPTESAILDREQFDRAVAAGDPQAVLLRLGDTELTLVELRQRVRQTLERGGQPAGTASRDLAWNVLEGMRRRAALYYHCEHNGLVDADVLGTRLDRWSETRLVIAQRQKRMVDLVFQDEARLRQFYDNNLGQFSSPVRWQLRRLAVPLGSRPTVLMAQLENAARNDRSLRTVHERLGGEFEELEPKTMLELRQMSEKLPTLVSPLEPGQVSDPYRNQDGLEIVELVARSEPEPLPFEAEETRRRVAAAYVRAYTREVYDELSDEILRSAELEIDSEALSEFRTRGLSTAEDISVEQLEEAFEQL